MDRSLLPSLCISIVAALGLQVQLAASIAVSEDVPVLGGTVAVARALGLDAVPDRARFVAELTRLVPRKNISVAAALSDLSRQQVDETVPVPLTADIWSDFIFHRRVAAEDLLFAILNDPLATLLCHGLSALDDETLAYLAGHPAIIRVFYERNAAAFGVFAGSLHIRGGRVVPPGGDAAIPLWEAVVGRSINRPDLFALDLFGLRSGRTAYLYDTVAQLDPAGQSFALGLGTNDTTARLKAMKALVTAWSGAFRTWELKSRPFSREPHDAAMALILIRADASGAPMLPNSRGLWSRVFESTTLPDDPATLLKTATDVRPIEAAWLVQAASGAASERLDRLDQLSFGQRAFASAREADMPDVLVALRAFPRFRVLMLTLERMGVSEPRSYAAAARLANRLSSFGGGRAGVATAVFQSVLALLQRMTQVGTLDAAMAELLVNDFVAVPLTENGRYDGAVAGWLDRKLRPVVPAADTLEASLLAALAGPPSRRGAASIAWEGHRYRLDFGASERRRLEAVRIRQGGLSVDLAVDAAAAAADLGSASVRPSQIESIGARLKAAINASSRELSRQPPKSMSKAMEELGRMAGANDAGGAARLGGMLADAADELTVEALMSLVYAVHLGDPDGAARLAGDISRRHDFGFGAKDGKMRQRAPWSFPREVIGSGEPWHVEGSLLGLDVALAPLGLRRLRTDRVLEAPTLAAEERDTFFASQALMDSRDLDDQTRDAVVGAIELGAQRISALARSPEHLDGVADEIRMDGWRRRAARWTLTHEPDRLESLFSLSEMLALGDPERVIEARPWGMSALFSSGCLCIDMPPPGRAQALAGRSEPGIMATAVSDLNLHVGRTLKQLGVPAQLARSVLSAAVQDFVDEVRPTDADDWLTLVRTARAVPPERIEDYVAAATASGPLVPER